MSGFTKISVKKDLYEQAKINAALANRSISNYIETLVLNDKPRRDEPRRGATNSSIPQDKVTDLATQDIKSSKSQANPPEAGIEGVE